MTLGVGNGDGVTLRTGGGWAYTTGGEDTMVGGAETTNGTNGKNGRVTITGAPNLRKT
jgi:hypothetical protein